MTAHSRSTVARLAFGMQAHSLQRWRNLHRRRSEPSSALNEKAAAYLFFLARNHPFSDGNKRTAYLAAATFLLMSGVKLRGSDDAVFELVLQTARGELPDVRAVAEAMGRLL